MFSLSKFTSQFVVIGAFIFLSDSTVFHWRKLLCHVKDNTNLVHWPLIGGLLHLVQRKCLGGLLYHPSRASVPVVIELRLVREARKIFSIHKFRPESSSQIEICRIIVGTCNVNCIQKYFDWTMLFQKLINRVLTRCLSSNSKSSC